MAAGQVSRTGRLIALAALAAALLGAAAVALTAPAVPLPSGAVPNADLTPVAYADLPGWAADDQAGALAAFRASCPGILADQTVHALLSRCLLEHPELGWLSRPQQSPMHEQCSGAASGSTVIHRNL